MITRLLRSILSLLVGLLDRFVKKEDLIAFYVTPRTRWDANQQILYALLSERNRVPVKVVDGNSISRRSPVKSLRVLYQVMRAKVIVFDHSLPPGLTKRHITYNVWHGSPIKKIRYGLPERFSPSFLEYQSSRTDYVLANSDFDGAILAEGLGVPSDKLLPIGLPRNDYILLSDTAVRKYDTHNELGKIAELTRGFSSVIVWCPTYRGDSHSENNPMLMSCGHERALVSLLEETNSLLLVRYHKFSTGEVASGLLSSRNVEEVTDVINSNLLLRFSDVLITDYSSVWVDFLLTHKPIVLFATDFDAYQEEHGFVGRFEDLTPVPLVQNFEDLLNRLRQVLGPGYSDEENARVADIYARYHGSRQVGGSRVLVGHIEESALERH